MKSCPTCSRTYPDDTLAFCLVDGSVLSAPYDPETTHILAPNLVGDTIPSWAPQPIFEPEKQEISGPVKRDTKRGVIVGAIICLLLVAGILVGANWHSWFDRNRALAEQSNSASTNSGSTIKTTASPISGITPASTPLPKSIPAIAKKLDITGTWNGTFANRDAILFINNQDGPSFSGILKNSKGAIVAISGKIDGDTRRISIREDRVVQGVTEGPDWVLGSNSGSLSADGANLSGSGKDRVGHGYTWAFHK